MDLRKLAFFIGFAIVVAKPKASKPFCNTQVSADFNSGQEFFNLDGGAKDVFEVIKMETHMDG